MTLYNTRKLFAILTALTLVFATTTSTQMNNLGTSGNPIQSIGNELAKIFGGLKTAHADPGADVFELDGNIVSETTTTSQTDWDKIFTDSVAGPCTPLSTLPSSFLTSSVPFCNHDDAVPDTSYFSTGSKDTAPISSGNNPWGCGTIANPTGKDHLLRGFAWAAKDPSTGDILFFVGGIREPKTQGSADWGVWFLKDNTVAPTCTTADTNNHPFVGQHHDGDELVTVEFTIGGTVGTINVFKWNGDDATGSLGNPTTISVTCINAPDPDPICGIANGGTAISPGPFPASVVCTSTTTTNCLLQNQFFEVGIDATKLFQNICFNTILMDTRSSPSGTATLKDFTVGKFITCTPATVPTKQAFDSSGKPLSTVGTTNAAGTPISGIRVGGTITYQFTEKNTSTGPLDITNVVAIDSLIGNLGAPTSGDTGDHILHQGNTWTWTKTFTVTTCSPVTNTVTFTGQIPLLGTAAPVEQASVTVNVICPATQATKHAYASAADAAAGTNPIDGQTVTRGATIYFVITETNISTGIPSLSQIKNVAINDPLLGLSGVVPPDSGETDGTGLLDVGETWKWTRSFTTSSANCNGVTNNVSFDGAMVLDGSPAPHETASVTVNVICPVVKITQFGYTNTPTDLHPTSGIVSGTTVFTATLHNFGTGSTTVTASLTSPTTVSTVSCTPSSLPGTVLASGADTTLSMTCTYTNAAPLTVVSAHLVVTYTLGSGPGKASGSPADISFTVESD